MVWDKQCLEDSKQKDHLTNEWMNEWMNHEAAYRPALATPGLLNMVIIIYCLLDELFMVCIFLLVYTPIR